MPTLLGKLGIRENQVIWLINPPEHLGQAVSDVKDAVCTSGEAMCDYIHLFAGSQEELMMFMPDCLGKLASGGMLWVSWPKKASGVATDLDREIVRDVMLTNTPLVDIKVCSVDDTWSGLKFVHRRK